MITIDSLLRTPAIKERFFKQCAYLADQCYDLDGAPLTDSDKVRKCLVVAKTHYDETWQRYSGVSAKELAEMLKLQRQGVRKGQMLHWIKEDKSIDGFSVRQVRFNDTLMDIAAGAWFLLPETLLYPDSDNQESLFSLDTPKGRLFFSSGPQGAQSLYQGGMVNTIDAYRHMVGISVDTPVTEVYREQFADFLRQQLGLLTVDKLIKGFSRQLNSQFSLKMHLLYLCPLLAISGYLAVSVITHWLLLWQLESEQKQLGMQISEVLEQKAKLDTINHQLTVFNQDVASRALIHPDWDVLNTAIELGARLQTMGGDGLTMQLRGQAPSASAVLAAVGKLPQVKSAVFSGAVRKNRGNDDFTLDITLNRASQPTEVTP